MMRASGPRRAPSLRVSHIAMVLALALTPCARAQTTTPAPPSEMAIMDVMDKSFSVYSLPAAALPLLSVQFVISDGWQLQWPIFSIDTHTHTHTHLTGVLPERDVARVEEVPE